MEEVYNKYNSGVIYTELFSDQLTLTINEYKCKEVTDTRYVAELKIPGRKAVQRSFSTIELLMLLDNESPLYLKRNDPEEWTGDYKRIIRKEAVRSIMREVLNEKAPIDNSWNADLAIRVISVKGYDNCRTYLIFRGKKTKEALNIIEKNFHILSNGFEATTGRVLEIPYEDSSLVNLTCLADLGFVYF